MDGWNDHPDYLTCGHIHKRQRIWNTDWARYTGSVLPMSFAEVDYKHGVDMITLDGDKPVTVEFLEYTPQHRLRILPEADEELTLAKLKKLIDSKLRARDENEKLTEEFDYVMLKVKLEKVNNDALKELEDYVASKDAVLCRIQKIIPSIDLTTIIGNQSLATIDDILDRNPMETVSAFRERFASRIALRLSGRKIHFYRHKVFYRQL